MEYTQAYEYARKSVENFLNNEQKLHFGTKGDDPLYGDGSLFRALFTTDYSLTSNSNVKKQVTGMLEPDSRSEPRFAALTRLRMLYTDLAISLGAETINALTSATAAAVASAQGYTSEKELKKRVKEVYAFIAAHPVVLPCIIGSSIYANRLLTFRSSQLLDTSRTTP